ncbi:uncharacterized protein EV420DRAFT_1645939 [Desarmillaria tabescens]|uniref:Uncharacterized protein n=1 Tax=Armillaria tabescens TaxID=1929756 RepID=A0AA39MZW2_ARMTA|nr:uncharacterized protein EV420DRAFT_1645939 [Desarmillaria tabescens]KAK0452000.1 hypothetical protein EV420DRAFT_1645939 [Desarmillaria tabescens]
MIRRPSQIVFSNAILLGELSKTSKKKGKKATTHWRIDPTSQGLGVTAGIGKAKAQRRGEKKAHKVDRSALSKEFNTLRDRVVLSIPLGQAHPTLRVRVADLHTALNLPTPDSTLSQALGVMNLTSETLPTALELLRNLPFLLPLTDVAPTVTLDTLDVLRRESRRRAHILWIFREEGFITDTRPLKLHMTLMNSTYRRPRTKRPQPFEYDRILRQAGVECFGVQESDYAELPMSVTMGSYDAPRVHL